MGQNEGLERLLKEHAFFSSLDLLVCETLAECAAAEQFGAGDYIFHEGNPANKFYLVHHGSVVLEIYIPGREPIVVDTLEDGDVLGWSWLVPPYKWAYDARSTQATELISLNATCLRGKYENDSVLACELFKRFIPVMADRLAATRHRIIEKAQASRSQGVR